MSRTTDAGAAGTAPVLSENAKQASDGAPYAIGFMSSTLLNGHRAYRPIFVLLTASTGCAMTVLEANVVAIVLPTIARDLEASFADVQWVVSSYVLFFASLLLPAGAVADRFGRRRMFLIGICAFALASLLCGMAPSIRALQLARAFQGAAAALLLAPALAIIGHTFRSDMERSRAWATWGGIMGLTMVLAPIVGGVVAHALGWRWAFHLNVGICAALASATLLFVGESRDEDARRLDPAGILLFGAAMFGLTWGLINGQAQGWTSVGTMAGFGVGFGALAAFVAAERAQDRPMLELRVFRNPRLIGAVWAMFAYAACAQVMASLLPLFLQNGLGHSALEAGFAMLPFALAMLAFPQVGRRLASRLTSTQILVMGLVVVGLGHVLTGWGIRSGIWPVVILGMLVIGSGGGLLNGETQKAIMSTVPYERAGMASGISTTFRFSGVLLGFALLSGVLATVVRGLLVGASCDPSEVCLQGDSLADAVTAGSLSQAISGLTETEMYAVISQARAAYSEGFSVALFTAAVIASLSAIGVSRLMNIHKRV